MFSAVGYCFSVTVASGFLFLFFVSFVCLGACAVVFLCVLFLSLGYALYLGECFKKSLLFQKK
jgi:hypothetical protein